MGGIGSGWGLSLKEKGYPGDRAEQKNYNYNICATIFIRRKSEVGELSLGVLCLCSVFVLGDGHS